MKRLLTVDDVAEILGVKKSTIYQWTSADFIPHIKLGKNVRFREGDVLAWIEKRTIKGRERRVPKVI